MHKNSKRKFLKKKIEPFNPKRIKNITDLLTNLKKCGFQGRKLGQAFDILHKMLTDTNCLTVLSLSGAMVPAGMAKIIYLLIERKLIDIIVSTGANITHDLIDAITKGGHYIGTPNIDDEVLYKNRINRIYDVLLPEDNYDHAEQYLLNLLRTLFKDRKFEITPSKFFKLIGNEINERCLLSIAADKNIPIFVPAISDSELALDLIKFTEIENYDIDFRVLKDVKKFARIIDESKECGTFIIGGGVPRNWTQQIFPYIENLKKTKRINSDFGYKYSVRIHTALEYDGGLSGCTVSESKSWGKYSLDSNYVSVWCDATIALPLLIMGLVEKLGLD